ncbi:hypothetical protein [Hymenobacter metallicola]|uniref:Uncharacterized protein n=1 Tax=Hymenobacter metallicola TaxID=2563114 RepID=A0A4Z0Q0X9_9BACT|nr:hypothetical protein [Hymenobacter metallicola]TGE22813.1 hypothetical protein E5K02_20830 [Hymenobacter metallicola]
MLALHTLPTEWGAVTLKQAAGLAALGDEAPIQACLAVLLNCPPTDLLTMSPKELGAALHQVLFLSEPMPHRETWARPLSIMLGEVEVPVLDTLEDLTFGQAADIGAAIQELGEDVPALRLRVLATILQPAYHGTAYDSDQVAEVEQLCGQVPLREALPLTDFFLPSSTASAESTPASSSASPSAKPSGPPTSGSSRRSGIRWPSWMPWQAATRRDGATSTS